MTMLRRSRPEPIWRSGDLPCRDASAELVEQEDGRALVRCGGEQVLLDELGMLLWPLLDGVRSAPSLARSLSDQTGAPALGTAIAVRLVLEELAAIGAVHWA